MSEIDRGWCLVNSILYGGGVMLMRFDDFDYMDCVAKNLTYEEAVALRNLLNAGGKDEQR